MIVGSRLRDARIKARLTQEQLGSLIGVGKSAICCYEKETRNPSLESIIELIYVLGVGADYLLGTDRIIKTETLQHPRYYPMTKEEVQFIEELRKDKMVYQILLRDPKDGSNLIKKKIG